MHELIPESVTHCPWCKKSASNVVYENLNDRVFRVVDFSTSLLKCLNCGSVYLSPRPTSESIYLAYQDYYTHGYSPPILEDLPLLSRLKLSLYNGFRNYHYNSAYTPSYAWGRYIYSFFPKYLKSLQQEMRYLPPQQANSSNAVLDVGCGNCGYLHMLSRGGWEAYGCDFDDDVLKLASNQSLHLRNGLSNSWSDHSNFFSSIVCSHVIEHLHDPLSELQSFYQLLKPGGFLYLELPNVNSWVFEIYGQDWLGLDAPRHLSLPSFLQLKASLQDIGFIGVSQVTIPRSFQRYSWRIQNGFDYRDSSHDGDYRPHRHSQSLSSERPDSLALTCIKPPHND
jgi:SAM-dependent methyltransferase